MAIHKPRMYGPMNSGSSGGLSKYYNHPDVPGAGAEKRKSIRDPKDKVHVVMGEFKRGTLRSGGSGKAVTNRKQAIAIALNSVRRGKS